MAAKATLEEAIAYRNPDVIYRFLKLYDIPREEAEELFVEVLARASSRRAMGS